MHLCNVYDKSCAKLLEYVLEFFVFVPTVVEELVGVLHLDLPVLEIPNILLLALGQLLP